MCITHKQAAYKYDMNSQPKDKKKKGTRLEVRTHCPRFHFLMLKIRGEENDLLFATTAKS